MFDILRVPCASEKGLVKLKESAQERQTHRDVTNRAAIDRIFFCVLVLIAPLAILPSLAPLIYHECIKNEAALSAASRTTTAPDTTPPSLPSTRISTHPMNWEACMFCQNASDMSMMSSVTTQEMSQHILDSSRFDQLANIRLFGVIDLIASEGK